MSINFSTNTKSLTKNIILGTAGHIDHGKTAFIKALTGIDCDRLKEEKERGISIELGYAHIRLPSGVKVGIIDVPGHESFIGKMIAGAAGIDVVALVIAADEGIKPQTDEHLAICEILGTTRGIIILNKKDLADDELLLLQTEEIKLFVEGTFLEGAPIIPVSSINGDGITEFIQALDRIAADVTAKPVEKPFRLPVDGVLTITGFGTVVRGTALSGHIAAGEEVVVLPGGRKSRIRGLQNHGQTIDKGYAGERLAINLTDIKKEEIASGMVVTRSDVFPLSDRFLVEFKHLPSKKKPLKRKTYCRIHTLTAQVDAEVNLLYRETMPPGEKGYAVVTAIQPLAVSHGDAFVMMGDGMYATIGGGRILNPVLPDYPESLLTEEYLRILSSGSLKEKIALFVRESGTHGIALLSLCGILNEGESTVREHVLELKRLSVIYEDDESRLFHRVHVSALRDNISRIVHDYHRVNPLRLGIRKEELFSQTTAKSGLFHLALSLMLQEGAIENSGDLVKMKEFNIGETDSAVILQRVQKKFFKYGLQPDFPADAAKKMNIDKRLFIEALNSLSWTGQMIKIDDNYYLHPDHFAHVVSSLKTFFEDNPVLTPPDVRNMFGLSRKYIIPLLEYLDSIKMTVRTPEGRRLRK